MTDGYYLGPPGHMIRIDGSHAGLVRGWGSPVTVHDGGLAPSYAFRSTRRPRRQWRIGLDLCTPDEVAGLHELLMSPAASLVLVDPWAQVTNVLSPEASVLRSAPAGYVPLPRVGGYDLDGGGRVLSAAYNADPAVGIIAGDGPVLPGGTVTASMWVGSPVTARVRVRFLDAAGASISYVDGSPVSGLDRLRRSIVTASVPSNAVAARVGGTGIQVAARAALTWTPHALPWDVGGAALRCVLGEVENGIEYAAQTLTGQRRTSSSVTVTEVGL